MDVKYINFGLYTIDINYLQYLHSVDAEVHFDADNHYERKPFIGIIIFMNGYNYFIPFTSGKTKHLSWDNVSKTHYLIYEMIDEEELQPNDICKLVGNGTYKKILSVLEIKKMIPAPDGMFHKIDINHLQDVRYKTLLAKEILFCRRIQNAILTKAVDLYQKQTESGIVRRYCCNFKLLEVACDNYIQ